MGEPADAGRDARRPAAGRPRRPGGPAILDEAKPQAATVQASIATLNTAICSTGTARRHHRRLTRLCLLATEDASGVPSSRRLDRYARPVAANRARRFVRPVADSAGSGASSTTSAPSSGPRSKQRGVVAPTAAQPRCRCNVTVCSPCPAAAATRSTTSCRRAVRATPASATTKSRDGCADGASMSRRSCCATSRSAPRSTPAGPPAG